MVEGSPREHVKITLIAKDASFQVRNKVSLPIVERYAKSMKAGTEFDPIKLANVEGMLILVDGWHRLAAIERLGGTHVYAEVKPANRQQAIWMAASANLQHGVPLKSSELRNVFRAYVTSRQHLQGKGQLRSYREIGAELGKGHTTIRNWMKKDFANVAARMAGNDCMDGLGGIREIALPDLSASERHIASLLEAFQSSSDPTFRGNVIGAVRATLADMVASGGWTEPEKPEF